MAALPYDVTKAKVEHLALEITQACNYKCTMCDYWRIANPRFMPIDMAAAFFDALPPDQVKSVLITGGEPLLHPEWRTIAAMMPATARKSICTNGSAILRKNRDVGEIFDRITVSIDGATDETFKRIRGYAHLSGILTALEEIKKANPTTIIYTKMTIQRENCQEVGDFFDLAASSGFIDGVGYGIPDFSQTAFGFDETGFSLSDYIDRLIPTPKQIEALEREFESINDRHADILSRGFMYEGAPNRYLQRFRYIRGLATAPPAPRVCSIPFQSLVLNASGSLSGCYFLDSVGTISDLKREGLTFHSAALENRVCGGFAACSKCDQLVFRNSPYEGRPENLH